MNANLIEIGNVSGESVLIGDIPEEFPVSAVSMAGAQAKIKKINVTGNENSDSLFIVISHWFYCNKRRS